MTRKFNTDNNTASRDSRPVATVSILKAPLLIFKIVFNTSGQFLVFRVDDFQKDFRRKLRRALMLFFSLQFELYFNALQLATFHCPNENLLSK